MDFPLSKAEHDVLQIIEDRFKECRIAPFTDEEMIEFQDILTFLCARGVLVDADINCTNAYMLTRNGSFAGFHKWLKMQEEKYRSPSFDLSQQTDALFSKLLKIAEAIATNATCNDLQENEINDYVRDMLKMTDCFEILDQSRHGLSTNGKGAGSVDILVSKNGNEVAVVEGMILDCVDKKYINSHIDKAIINYNPLSNPVFLLAYVKASDYSSFWDKCFDYLSTYEFPNDIIVKKGFESHTPNSGAVRIATGSIEHNDITFPVYFIAIKLLKSPVHEK